MTEFTRENIKAFLEMLGLDEEPMGMYYTDSQPEEGFCPKGGTLPTVQQEARGESRF